MSRTLRILPILTVSVLASLSLPVVAQATYSEPLSLEPATTTGSGPQIAVGPDGTAHAVWWHASGGSRWVRYASISGGVATAPITVSASVTAALGEQRGPQVAVDQAGLVHIAWSIRNPDATTGPVQYATVDDGVASAPQNLDSATTDKAWVRLAVSPDGIAHVVWSDRFETATVGYRRIHGGSVTHSWTLSSVAYLATHIGIGVGADGTAHVVWRHKVNDPGNGPYDLEWEIRHASIAPDGTIATGEATIGTPAEASNMNAGTAPVVAVDDNGVGHAAWSHPQNYETDEWQVHYTELGSGVIRTIFSGAGQTGWPRGIGVDSDGDVHLGWGFFQSGMQLRHTVISGGVVGTPVNVFSHSNFEVVDDHFTLDAATGTAHFVWRVPLAQNFVVKHATAGADSATAPETVSGTTRVLRELPRVAVGPDGATHVIWQEGPNGSNRQVMYSLGANNTASDAAARAAQRAVLSKKLKKLNKKFKNAKRRGQKAKAKKFRKQINKVKKQIRAL